MAVTVPARTTVCALAAVLFAGVSVDQAAAAGWRVAPSPLLRHCGLDSHYH